MRFLKIFGFSLLGLILLLVIGGYFFVKKNFTPDPNYLELSETSNFVPITWAKSQYSDIAALLLPIKFEGIPDTFYLQFDTGSTSTLLNKNAILSIQEKYPDQFLGFDSTSARISQTFQLGDMTIHSKKIKIYDGGYAPIDWSRPVKKIGTLGADLIDKKLTIMDFKDSCVYFGEAVPDTYGEVNYHNLKYKKRRVLIPAVVAGKKRQLLHDTGTSGFELITNKKSWNRLAKKGAEPQEAFKVKSWKRQLTAYNIPSDKQIEFKPLDIDLNQVTYIKGASFMQQAAMRVTGMGGMIGNQIFMEKVLILDCKNSRYSILE